MFEEGSGYGCVTPSQPVSSSPGESQRRGYVGKESGSWFIEPRRRCSSKRRGLTILGMSRGLVSSLKVELGVGWGQLPLLALPHELSEQIRLLLEGEKGRDGTFGQWGGD